MSKSRNAGEKNILVHCYPEPITTGTRQEHPHTYNNCYRTRTSPPHTLGAPKTFLQILISTDVLPLGTCTGLTWLTKEADCASIIFVVKYGSDQKSNLMRTAENLVPCSTMRKKISFWGSAHCGCLAGVHVAWKHLIYHNHWVW